MPSRRRSRPASKSASGEAEAAGATAPIVSAREYGFLRETMVAPVRRSSIVLGKCLGGATVAGFQGLIMLALAWTVHVPYSVTLIVGVFALEC
jgi:ABC-2 type transport system permease protein